MFDIDYTVYESIDPILGPMPPAIKTKKYLKPDMTHARGPKEADGSKNLRIEYLDELVSYDTETSSWRFNVLTGAIYSQSQLEAMSDDEKQAVHAVSQPASCVYAHTFAVAGKGCLLRSWGEFLAAYNKLCKHYKVSYTRRLIVWVQNLPYEFQFMRKRLNFKETFSVGDRAVVRAITAEGVEFRDMLTLSKMKLEEVATRLRGYSIRKLTSVMDYQKIRHERTPLTDDEKAYILHDGIICNCYIDNKRDEDGGLLKIPMTDTGYVRRDTRDMCLNKGDDKAEWKDTRTGRTKQRTENGDYKNLMKSLQLGVSDYLLSKDVFAGAITHADSRNVNKTLRNVASYDETSAYPSVQVAEKYPMTPFVAADDIQDEFDVYEYSDAGYIVFFRCVVVGLREHKYDDVGHTVNWEHVLSESKVRFFDTDEEKVYRKVDNGRLIEAAWFAADLTNVDLEYLGWFYDWDEVIVTEARISKAGYLPKEFIEAVLHFYELKCKLKGVKGKKLELQKAKGELNSEYGMLVMDIIRQWCHYDGLEWSFVENKDKTLEDMEEELWAYNNDPNRFTFYPWGVMVTAWNRYKLAALIRIFEPYKHDKDDENGAGFYSDYVYADTDSCKFMHPERYAAYVEELNAEIVAKIDNALRANGIDPERGRPKGKQLGIWDYEGTYTRFKTLGAKRYMNEHWVYPDEEKGEDFDPYLEIEATVAGCNKKKFSRWLSEQENPFESFKFGLVVPYSICGRMVCQYLDEMQGGDVIDYLGNRWVYCEESAVYMEPGNYTMSISGSYEELLMSLNLI